MAAQVDRNFLWRGDCEMAFFPEADSQTYKAGDFVTMSSGKVAIAVASGSELDTSGAEVLGKVLRDARNTTGNTLRDVPVILARNTEFFFPVYATLATDAEYQDVAEGSSYRLRNQGGIFCINMAGANGIVQVKEKNDSVPALAQFEGVWGGILITERVYKD